MHEHDAASTLRTHAEHCFVFARTHIIHDVCARLNCSDCNFGACRVYRNRDATTRANGCNDRYHATNLLACINACCAWPCGLAANVDDVRAFLSKSQRLRDRGVRIERVSAITETVWRDIHNAHQRERLKREQPIWTNRPVTRGSVMDLRLTHLLCLSAYLAHEVRKTGLLGGGIFGVFIRIALSVILSGFCGALVARSVDRGEVFQHAGGNNEHAIYTTISKSEAEREWFH